MAVVPGNLLKQVNTPADLRRLSEGQLEPLCNELRRYIIEVIAANPGHLGASLGIV